MLKEIIEHYRQRILLHTIFQKIKGLPINRDISNKFKYGYLAPVYAERIWVNPSDCNLFISHKFFKDFNGVTDIRGSSGKVIDYSLLLKQAIAVTKVIRIKFCFDHWVKGLPWEDTGVYEYMEKFIIKDGEVDGCRSINDIIKRYKKIDSIFEQVKQEGRLKTRKEINSKNFREVDGILIHIGPQGKPIFSGGGCHRFAMALILGLRFPAQIGCVHPSAIPFLPDFRRETLQ